ncbi:hypothetical protein GN244_ATG09187 [Phytophthora infestans]|uniref:SET domain-containing protein n=1 Tax=Phytophthora infestans TaxID=4787 RepID=A0A833WE00_PHYIN|nr:hypothetical protein GN244_ATG09187 [Phytophthora infestans]
MRGITAAAAIPARELIGEYLGQINDFGSIGHSGTLNGDYRTRLKTQSTGNKHVGSIPRILRMVNHSCKPSARFHEVQAGKKLTVVAVTI